MIDVLPLNNVCAAKLQMSTKRGTVAREAALLLAIPIAGVGLGALALGPNEPSGSTWQMIVAFALISIWFGTAAVFNLRAVPTDWRDVKIRPGLPTWPVLKFVMCCATVVGWLVGGTAFTVSVLNR